MPNQTPDAADRRVPPGGYRVTLVGFTPEEAAELKQALSEHRGSFRVEVLLTPSADRTDFPLSLVHGIVFTPQSFVQAQTAGVEAVRRAMQPGTCRVYLFMPKGIESSPDTSPLDDFVQRMAKHDSGTVATTMIRFFKEASDLNRRSTMLALRDKICRVMNGPLGLLWPVSYVMAALHLLNAVGTPIGHPVWPSLLNMAPLATFADFCSLFFIVHCTHVLLRNGLFGLRVRRRFDCNFFVIAAALCAAILGVLYSMAMLGHIRPTILALVALAAAVQQFYLYTRRIRVECASLSGLHDRISDRSSRKQTIENIGNARLTPYAFTLLRKRQQDVFISYMHKSAWSAETARKIYGWVNETGRRTFLDSSTIPAGALWRKQLLCSVSECGCFIAILDGEAAATDWVLAESAYAALLRKTLGKPNIILVVRNAHGLEMLRQCDFGTIYRDVFQIPISSQYGTAIIDASRDGFSAGGLLGVMKNIRPMSLLG